MSKTRLFHRLSSR